MSNVRRCDSSVPFLSGCRGALGSGRDFRWVICAPVSQIWALTVLPSTLMERVANSTPIVDFDSRLNSLRVNRERTAQVR